jgi:hypothetical protein
MATPPVKNGLNDKEIGSAQTTKNGSPPFSQSVKNLISTSFGGLLNQWSN